MVDDPRGPTEREEGEGLEFVPGEALRGPWGGARSCTSDRVWVRESIPRLVASDTST